MNIEEFSDLPSRLEDWTYETVVNLVKNHDFEPGTFDFKDALSPTGPPEYKEKHLASIRRTACAMANTSGGFIIFGVKDRKNADITAPPEDRIIGVPIHGELLNDFGSKITVLQPEVYFEAVPQVLRLPHNSSKGVFVIRIPKSQRRPHMVFLEGTSGIYYRRGEHGAAVVMSHSEVQEQMMYTEERLQKVKLLCLELMQYREVSNLIQFGDGIVTTPYRFDVSAFKVLLADICGLIPSELLRRLLRVPLTASTINTQIERAFQERQIQGTGTRNVQSLQQRLPEFHNDCVQCEEILQNLFGISM